jgi:hypothetical protein
MDAWSDQNRRSYLAITAHWIGHVNQNTLQSKSALIAFHHLQGPGGHKGEAFGKIVVNLLDRVGVTVKV